MKLSEVKFEVYWHRKGRKTWKLDNVFRNISQARAYIKDMKENGVYPDEDFYNIVKVHIEREVVE